MVKKFPFHRQLDSIDCGPTCLRMICKFYGRNIELYKIREYSNANREGVSMLGLSEAAEKLGFRTAGIKSDFGRFANKAILPCIIHWRSHHFCVVYKIKAHKNKDGGYEGKVYVADPAFGLATYTVDEFLDGWIHGVVDSKDKGFFLQLIPTISFFNSDYAGDEGKKIKPGHFFSYIKTCRRFFYRIGFVHSCQDAKISLERLDEIDLYNGFTSSYGTETPFTGELTGAAEITIQKMTLLQHFLNPLRHLFNNNISKEQ